MEKGLVVRKAAFRRMSSKGLVARKAASRSLSSVFARRFHSWVVGLALVPVTRILARYIPF
ncbi:hypothetical protein HanPI659440_Chr14g0525981 [Helianthus annuus]|nr:hypothetical protein HanPI659440_Chr14g0525981 [Helianthus annuus]